MTENSTAINVALALIPFAGIAFLWFIGVIRDRLGEFEDRFFASVVFGSGLLFLALVFMSAAIAASLLTTYGVLGDQMVDSGLYSFGREMMFRVTNTYAIRMAGVFMISVGTIWLRTRTTNRWLVVLTYVAALVLLFTMDKNMWVVLIFPAWVLVVSVHILFTNMAARADTDTGTAMADVE